MSVFSSFTASGNRNDLERALLHPTWSQRTDAVLWTGTFDASIAVPGPFFRYAGRWLDAVYCTARAVSAPIIAFRVQIVSIDGVVGYETVARTPTAPEFTSLRPVRLHTTPNLKIPIPDESTLVVRSTATSGNLTDPVFNFVTLGG